MKHLFACHPEGVKEPTDKWIFLGQFDNDTKLCDAAKSHAVLNIHSWGNYRYVVISGDRDDLDMGLDIEIKDNSKEKL